MKPLPHCRFPWFPQLPARMNQVVVGLAIVFTLLAVQPAMAHKPSDSYLRIFGGGKNLRAEWDIALKDLEILLAIDSDQNGKITWGELREKKDLVTSYALGHLQLVADGEPAPLRAVDLQVNQHSDGAYAVLLLESDAAGNAAVLEMEYELLFDVDPTHRGLVVYRNGTLSKTAVLSPSEPRTEMRTHESRPLDEFVAYVAEGVWHIWIGYDHILFLLSLLLPSVLALRGREWDPVHEFKPTLRAVMKLVTVFTIAHSITLWLAVMQYVTLPSQLVEATIAFSIIITALNNLYPIASLSSWAIAFAFGLVHGFGFANVLMDLGLSNVALAISLFGFNVGVELGQLAIVLAFLPVAYILRASLFYRWVVFRCGSVAVGVIASVWMYERVFNVTVLGI